MLNRPLLIHPGKAEVILGVLAGRIGVGEIEVAEPEPGAATEGRTQANRFIGSHRREDGSIRLTRARDGVASIPVIGSLVNRGAWIGTNSGLTSYEGLAAQALALPMTWSEANPSPATAGDRNVITFGAARIELGADELIVTVGGAELRMEAGGGIRLTGSEIRTDGTTILDNGTRKVHYVGGKDSDGDSAVDGAARVFA